MSEEHRDDPTHEHHRGDMIMVTVDDFTSGRR
jgi:hypothetical protein